MSSTNSDDEKTTPPQATPSGSDLSGTSAPDDEVAEDAAPFGAVPTLEEALGVRTAEDDTASYYAWSPIRYDSEKDSDGNIVKNRIIKVGAAVSASRLGVNDEEFQALVSSGAVRSYPFPDDMPEGYGGSPVDWLKQKVRAIESEAEQLTSSLNISAQLGSGARV